MLTQVDIRDKVCAFVRNYFVKDTGLKFKDDTSFLEEGIIDSTGVMELVAFLEETFDFRVEDEEIVPETFDSIKKLVKYVDSKLANKLNDLTPNPEN